MRTLFFTCLAMLMLPAGANAAPSGLYGKSVRVSWTETRSQRAVGQQPAFQPVSIPFTVTVYISTEGRPFQRITSTSPGGVRGGKEKVGASGSGAVGGFALQFQGNTMVLSRSNGGYGSRAQVTFDSGFSSCTAQVIAAKESGSKSITLRSIATGQTIEVESVSAGSASCSITNGNAFAN